VLTKSCGKRSKNDAKRKNLSKSIAWTRHSGCVGTDSFLLRCAYMLVLLKTMRDPLRRKLFFFLIATLNSVFIREHDFSMTYPDDFERVPSMCEVMRKVKTYLTSVLQKDQSLLLKLWREIDKTITLKNCEIYTFVPDGTDPLSQGLWSFNYLFFNRKLKRIACFTCISKSVCDSSGEESEEDYVSDVSY